MGKNVVVEELTATDVVRLRMRSLLLDGSAARTPGEIVTWFGAMQAQDLASGKWSFGVRLPHLTEADIDAAIESGDVLRTWPMRGTIHFVPPGDARWMLEATGVRALSGAAARREYLGLDLATVDKAADILRSALRGGKSLTRTEAIRVMNDGGIHTAGQHSYHIIWYVSQIGVTCIGPNQGKEQTIVLLDEWAPDQRSLSHDDGLRELAFRYFRSHGPTSHQDFMGWAGIPARDARAAILANGDDLVSVPGEGKTLWMTPQLRDQADEILATGSAARTWALPGFDEFLLGYKDRSLVLADEFKQRIIPGSNGVFQPTLVHQGRVIGTWRRAVKKTRVDVTLLPFQRLTKTSRAGVDRAFAHYSRYVGLEVRTTVGHKE